MITHLFVCIICSHLTLLQKYAALSEGRQRISFSWQCLDALVLHLASFIQHCSCRQADLKWWGFVATFHPLWSSRLELTRLLPHPVVALSFHTWMVSHTRQQPDHHVQRRPSWHDYARTTMKELIMDLRNNWGPHSPISLDGTMVKIISCFSFPGTTDLRGTSVDPQHGAMLKRAYQQWCLRKCGMSTQWLINFYCGTIELQYIGWHPYAMAIPLIRTGMPCSGSTQWNCHRVSNSIHQGDLAVQVFA